MGVPDALAKRIDEAERKAKEAAEKLKQLKARKSAIDARQKAIEAKRSQAVENRLKFEVGGLVKIAGLMTMDPGALLGALLIEADKLQDAEYLAAAKRRGAGVLASRKAASNPAAPISGDERSD